MDFTKKSLALTHTGAMAMLSAGIAEAETMGQPQCIVIVDASGEVIAEIRMTGAKFLSRKSALAKAQTAASIRAESMTIPEDFGTLIAAATGGSVTRLGGGLPIIIDGEVVGGIGVGSGSADQDRQVGFAALAAVGARTEL
ncbi:MAG: heme-binding protein [Pseudomonadota bacterium]